jgi:hypothetical protein
MGQRNERRSGTTLCNRGGGAAVEDGSFLSIEPGQGSWQPGGEGGMHKCRGPVPAAGQQFPLVLIKNTS